MSDHPPALVVHQALLALHRHDMEELALRLHPDVIYDSGRELIAGRDAVASSLAAPRFEHLEAEIVPGRIEDHGDRLIAHTLTILHWRGSSEPADISPQALAIQVDDDLIARLELLAPPSPTPSAHCGRAPSQGSTDASR